MVALYGIISGVFTYLFISFIFQPIMRYKDLKAKIISDLAFYANAIQLQNEDKKNELYLNKVLDRAVNNRRHACDLEAALYYLPKFYLDYLHAHDEYPSKASEEMMGLANTFNLSGYDRIERVRSYLRLDRVITL